MTLFCSALSDFKNKAHSVNLLHFHAQFKSMKVTENVFIPLDSRMYASQSIKYISPFFYVKVEMTLVLYNWL